jgi:hypothetical protein
MAQWWSDHLDTLREGATIIPIGRAKGVAGVESNADKISA